MSQSKPVGDPASSIPSGFLFQVLPGIPAPTVLCDGLRWTWWWTLHSPSCFWSECFLSQQQNETRAAASWFFSHSVSTPGKVMIVCKNDMKFIGIPLLFWVNLHEAEKKKKTNLENENKSHLPTPRWYNLLIIFSEVKPYLKFEMSFQKPPFLKMSQWELFFSCAFWEYGINKSGRQRVSFLQGCSPRDAAHAQVDQPALVPVVKHQWV